MFGLSVLWISMRRGTGHGHIVLSIVIGIHIVSSLNFLSNRLYAMRIPRNYAEFLRLHSTKVTAPSTESLNRDNISPRSLSGSPEFIPKKPRGYNRFNSLEKFTYDPVKRREREILTKENYDESRGMLNNRQRYNQNISKELHSLTKFSSSSTPQPKASQEIGKILNLAAMGDAKGSVDALKEYLAHSERKKRISIREFNILIKNLGDDGFLDQCNEVVDCMRNYGCNPSIITYSTLISRAATWKKIETAEMFFKQMVADGIKADVQAYNSLINAYTKTKDMDRALLVFNEMVESRVLPSVITFNNLIECCARNGNVTRAIEIFQLMKNEYDIDPNERSYSALVLALCQGGRAKMALELVNRMEPRNIKPSAVTFSALLHGLGTEGDLNAAFEVLTSMKRKGLSPNVVTMSSLIHSCGIHDRLDLAFALYREMLNETKIENLPNSVTCSALVDACLKRGHVDWAIEVVHDMRKLKLKLTEVTYTSLITELSRLHKLDQLMGILNPTPSPTSLPTATLPLPLSPPTSTSKSPSPCIPVALALGTTVNTSTSLRRLHDLSSVPAPTDLRLWAGAGLQPSDEREEEDFITLFATSNASTNSLTATNQTHPTYKAAVMAYENMKKQGRAPDELIFKNLMKSMTTVAANGRDNNHGINNLRSSHIRHDGRLFRLYLVFQEMRASGVQPDTAAYNTLINACASGGDIERALEAVKAMQSEGVKLDAITYTSLIKACGINGGPGTIALAEELFEAMQQRTNHFSSYTEPTELTFQRLMQAHLRGDASVGSKEKKVINTKRVWSLMENLLQRGLKPGVSICRSCIRAACHDGDAKMALELLQVLRTTTRVKYDYVSWEQVARLCSKTKGFAEEVKILRKEIEEKRASAFSPTKK